MTKLYNSADMEIKAALRLWFPILVIKYVDSRVGATELIIKLKTKCRRKVKFFRCVLWKCRRLIVKEIWLL